MRADGEHPSRIEQCAGTHDGRRTAKAVLTFGNDITTQGNIGRLFRDFSGEIEEMIEHLNPEVKAVDGHALVHAMEHSGKIQFRR